MRKDPYMAFNYIVELDGIVSGGFSEVSGLSITTAVERKREGGENGFEHVFVKETSFPDLTLTRGLADFDSLYQWYIDVTQGKIKRKSGSIILLDEKYFPVMWWDFKDAFPTSWAGPSLNATASSVATEKFTVVHEGLFKRTTLKGALT